MTSLGKIDKPDASDYLHGRKVYLVRMLEYIPGAPGEYRTLYEQYWDAAQEHLASLEAKTGVVKHIFCEGVPGKGEDARVAIERTNPGALRLLKTYIDSGLKIAPFEDDKLLWEVVDWGNCLSVGLISQTVADTIQKHYQEANQKRQEAQFAMIDDHVGRDEAAVVLFGSHNINIPDNLQRFLVSPPELDKAERWLKQFAMELAKRQEQAAQKQQSEPQQDGGTSESGLWTPS